MLLTLFFVEMSQAVPTVTKIEFTPGYEQFKGGEAEKMLAPGIPGS